jgi:hypothetical protein
MAEEQRQVAREESNANAQDAQVATNLNLVKVNWQNPWNCAARHPDYFRAYVLDQRSASSVWEQAREEIFVIVNVKRRPIFSNIENLCQLLFG